MHTRDLPHLTVKNIPQSQSGEYPMSPSHRPAIDVALLQVAPEVNPVVTTVPGGYNMPLLTGVLAAGLRLLVGRSELGAAFIGSGLAWETGLPSLIIVITSPGVYGVMQALHAASVHRVPIVLLSGETSIAGSVQCGDGVDGPSTTRVTAALCAWSADITRSDAVPGAVLRAVRLASALRRPVHLNIPVHVANGRLAS